jgi:hypothetical protein
MPSTPALADLEILATATQAATAALRAHVVDCESCATLRPCAQGMQQLSAAQQAREALTASALLLAAP